MTADYNQHIIGVVNNGVDYSIDDASTEEDKYSNRTQVNEMLDDKDGFEILEYIKTPSQDND